MITRFVDLHVITFESGALAGQRSGRLDGVWRLINCWYEG
jgi:hypothetical protein